MKGIWRGEDDPLFGLTYGKVYEILGFDFNGTMAGVVDASGDSYLYPTEDFEMLPEEEGKGSDDDKG